MDFFYSMTITIAGRGLDDEAVIKNVTYGGVNRVKEGCAESKSVEIRNMKPNILNTRLKTPSYCLVLDEGGHQGVE